MGKNSTGVAQIFVLLTLALVIVGGYWYFLYNKGQNKVPDVKTPSPSPTSVISVTPKAGDSKTVCEKNGGRWLTDFNECENILENVCTANGGTFDPCASACRHEEGDGPCILLCVEVCKFN